MKETENERKSHGLKEQWAIFGGIIFGPWILILLIAIAGFIILSVTSENKTVTSILSVIISILSGLLGGVITSKLSQLTEGKVLVAKGKSAIRSLNLILLSTSGIKKRTKDYLMCLDKKSPAFQITNNNFEEIIEKCKILEEEILSSIENWTDIIPEVSNLKTQISIIGDLQASKENLEKELAGLNKQLTEVKEQNTKDKQGLREIITKKEKELNDAKRLIQEKEREMNKTGITGLTSSYLNSGSIGVNSTGLVDIAKSLDEIAKSNPLSGLSNALTMPQNAAVSAILSAGGNTRELLRNCFGCSKNSECSPGQKIGNGKCPLGKD